MIILYLLEYNGFITYRNDDQTEKINKIIICSLA